MYIDGAFDVFHVGHVEVLRVRSEVWAEGHTVAETAWGSGIIA